MEDLKKEQEAVDKSKAENGKLSDDQIEDVSGGAMPTPVNGQITDSVTQANVKVLG